MLAAEEEITELRKRNATLKEMNHLKIMKNTRLRNALEEIAAIGIGDVYGEHYRLIDVTEIARKTLSATAEEDDND